MAFVHNVHFMTGPARLLLDTSDLAKTIVAMKTTTSKSQNRDQVQCKRAASKDTTIRIAHSSRNDHDGSSCRESRGEFTAHTDGIERLGVVSTVCYVSSAIGAR